MEYKVVEAWGAMSYVDAETGEDLCVEGEDSLQGYWVVLYDPDEKEVIEWIEMFPTEEQAQEYKKKLEQEK